MVPVKVTAAKARVHVMRRHFFLVSSFRAAISAGEREGGSGGEDGEGGEGAEGAEGRDVPTAGGGGSGALGAPLTAFCRATAPAPLAAALAAARAAGGGGMVK